MSERAGREVELKLRVKDSAALIKIAIASGGIPEDTAQQTNAFFDTPDRALGARGYVVRLREERTATATRWFVTAKGAGQRTGNLTDVLEEEVAIDAAAAAAIRAKGDALTHLEVGTDARRSLAGVIRGILHGRPLEPVGQFDNERVRVPVELPLDGARSFRAVLELDRTSFPGGLVHHEVEMEVPDDVDPAEAGRALQALFDRAGVVGRSSPGKARRFFAALRGERLE